MAEKHMKTLLHLAARGAIRAMGQLQDYYQPKVKGAGPRRDKNKMSVLNPVGNKLVLCVFDVVSKNQKYDKNYN